jgi:hypothetical protein
MPAIEPSSKAARNQEQLATILIPIFVMLGAIGLSYGIYTALKWLQLLKRQNVADATWFDTESEDMSVATETPQSTSGSAQCIVQRRNEMPSLGRDAILARKAMKEGLKPLILGVVPVVTPRVPERAIERWHGVRYI